VTFLIGENGSGKSTLLEAIAVARGFNAEGGTKNFRFNTALTLGIVPNACGW
jgi:predicted ATPase